MSVRVGVGLFTGQIPSTSGRTFAEEYRDTLELVRRAEALGFDSAWVSEHHGTSDGYLPSLLTMLAAFAAVTERIALGTGVILTPLHDPIRLAEDAAVVDQLSSGRLILGLGLGWREEEFRMLRIPMRERLARHVDTVEILRRAWTGDRFSFEGKAYRYENVLVVPPPFRRGGPPIYLGGYTEASARRVGRLADGYIVDADDLTEVETSMALAEEAAREAGRDPGAIGLALMVNAWVSDSDDPWSEIRAGVTHQLGAYGAWDKEHDTPAHDSLEPDPLTEEELRASTVAGTQQQVAEELRRRVEPFRGRRELHLIVRLHYPGMELQPAARAMQLFAEGVLPALRDA
jgi:probable F420-dependent oxidoreductase